jgi:DNA topoisomerase-1
MDQRRFIATDIGKIVSRFLTKYFTEYVEYGFTAAMEDELDAISRGEEPWITPLAKFWKPFTKRVEEIEKTVSREEVAMSRDLGIHPESGRPVSVRMGRFGPFVQAGTKDDEEKPKFAGLRPGQKMDSITLAEALDLFQLPRTLGVTAEGDTVTVAIGRFGPYVKFGAKYVSLKDPDDPYTVTLERALEAIEAKKLADANRIIIDFGVDDIQVLNGRYGPYITDRQRNARIPKERDPKSMTLEECRALLAAAPVRPQRGRFGKAKGKSAAPRGQKAAKPVAPPKEPKEPRVVKPKTAAAKPKAKAKAKPKKSAAKKTAAKQAAA